MILSPSVNIYLKTTETCNLNCRHCFTSGSNGKRIFFNPEKTVDFLTRLRRDAPWVRHIRIMFHGGEPLLAPIKDLQYVCDKTRDLFPSVSFDLQTNLVYPLKDEQRQFMKKELYKNGFGTSWDYKMRFGSTAPDGKQEEVEQKQIDLWEKNVKKLIQEDGHAMTMIVSMNKALLLNKEPKEVIEYAHSLGFKYILFERITSDGNATLNDVLPGNKLQDEWMLKMWDQTIEHKLYNKIGNMLLSEFAEAIVNYNHTANRCRICEKSLLTINADGTIAGCPNTGPREYWGHIEWSIKENLHSKKRLKTISCEMTRNEVCLTCPAYAICNGDCHQLLWEGDLCAAPKSIWKKSLQEGNLELYKNLILP